MKISDLLLLFFLYLLLALVSKPIYSQFPPPPGNNYAVDINGTYYVPHQLIIQYNSDWNPMTADSLRQKYDVISYETCGCGYNRLELWTLADTIIIDSVEAAIIEEKGASAEAEAIIENTGYNFYTATESTEGCLVNPDPLSVIPSYTTQYQDPDWLVVAILDTGIDYDHPDLQSYLWYNDGEANGTLDGIDNELNCFEDDIIGYNFAYDHNNPKDDNGHGTHVAGIMASTFHAIDPTGAPNVRLMSVKTHDSYGYANLFDATCGIYYAMFNGAKVINASWGYYGTKSLVLGEAINIAAQEDVLVVCSAGNYGLDVDGTIRHFPSSFDNDNLIVVTAMDDTQKILESSNFSNVHVDVAVQGTNVLSTIPEQGYYTKTGTSMSTAVVSSYVADRFRLNQIASYTTIKNLVLSGVVYSANLVDYTKEDGYLEMPVINVWSDYVTIDARIQLQGAYDSNTGMMRDDLRAASLVPILNPYNCLEYMEDPKILNTTGANAIVDWVLLELRDQFDPNNILVTERAGLLTRSGKIVDVDGVSPLKFYADAGYYYVTVRHRNHLPIITRFPVLLQQQATVLSFHSNPILVGPMEQVFLGGFLGHVGLIAGDTNGDCHVDSGDRSLTWNMRNQSGYSSIDISMDGVIDSGDRSFVWNNRNLMTSAPCE